MSAPRDLVAEARALADEMYPGLLNGLADEVEALRAVLASEERSVDRLTTALGEANAARIKLRAQLDVVRAHINGRPEYITACLNAGPDNDHDYYRWQGGAEARRQLAQDLDWTVPHKPGETTAPKDGQA
ncbi:hypothetical protein [Nocardia sp. NPDC051833]|uniref:hypothetical protein n=1 Tax=Nocardia sp. NPDC051833 TaxID=3155674 RepID=UPI003438E887